MTDLTTLILATLVGGCFLLAMGGSLMAHLTSGRIEHPVARECSVWIMIAGSALFTLALFLAIADYGRKQAGLSCAEIGRPTLVENRPAYVGEK